MTALAFLFLALLISGVGSVVLVLRNRQPTSVESGIDEFRREMDALAPPERPVPPRRERSVSDGAGRPAPRGSRPGGEPRGGDPAAPASPADPDGPPPEVS